jgi:glycosyltransferase involved in cell wall biosynthesis
MQMFKVDLHVHSKYSEHPSEWFLQRLGANECYTEPEQIYTLAKSRGMSAVTITDHNRIDGCLKLQEQHPEDVFMGVESTAYFPEDGTKVHLLIYGFKDWQFDEIQVLRKNIYELRDYLVKNRLSHSLAHATYPVNSRLTLEHLEKLILLFNVFEAINGGRDRTNNLGWWNVLLNLTPEHISDLYTMHRIEPQGDEPWVKGLTGGSDDHAGIFIGRTYTLADSSSLPDFIDALKGKHTKAVGRHNDYRSLALSVYKVAYDFSKTKGNKNSNSLINQLTELVFNQKSLRLSQKLQISKLKLFKRKGDAFQDELINLIDYLRFDQSSPIESRMEVIYDKIANMTDGLLKSTCNSIERELSDGEIVSVFGKLSALLPGIFLSAPFFSTFWHLNKNHDLINSLKARFSSSINKKPERILWFTDTLNDLNGVSVTLRELSVLATTRNIDLKMAVALSHEEQQKLAALKILSLPFVYSFRLPYYENYSLKIPSPLKALKLIYDYNPDKIYISTPGPVGLFGLLVARLFNIPVVGIYHTDFKSQAADIVDDEVIVSLLESYSRWFYNAMDQIWATDEYFPILDARGYDYDKIQRYYHGIDTNLFSPIPDARKKLDLQYGLKKGITLLYTGRISKDKGLDLLSDLYHRLLKNNPEVNLIIVGDGPYRQQLQEKMRGLPRVFFTGSLDRASLPLIYSACDLFLFPSTADTFGLSVLEAQSCGVPAVISDMGGQKEIVIDEITGSIARAGDLADWVDKVNRLIAMIKNNPEAWQELKAASRANAQTQFSWELVLERIFLTSFSSYDPAIETDLSHVTENLPTLA